MEQGSRAGLGRGARDVHLRPQDASARIGTWWVVFLDDSDQAGALAYHDLTNEGLPISKVFVKSIQADKASLSVGATHEICEMAVDPWLNSAYQDPKGVFWAGEVCDPVEDDQYGYDIGGVLVTDFVTPNWFAHAQAQATIDLKGHAKTPFEVLTGGYAKSSRRTRVGSRSPAPRRCRPFAGPRRPRAPRRERRERESSEWKKSDVKWSTR